MKNKKIKFLLLMQTVIFLMFSINSCFSQPIVNTKDWKKLEIRLLSFLAPSDLASKPFKGDDSEVWKYVSSNLELTIDFGLHSERPAEDKNEDNYTDKSVIINKKKATIVFFKFKDSDSLELKYVAAVYFSQIGSDEDKLSFVAYCKSPKEQKIAEKIFYSIKFKKQKA